MTKIGLISDTHSYIDDAVFGQFAHCDEIWHGGDFGNIEIIEKLRAFKPLKGVYGNIDDGKIRTDFPEVLIFNCEEIKVMMKHIGGYPPKYNAETKKQILQHQPQLFISGHSHILKIIFDDKLNCLHINPGAYGKQGWHKLRTLVTFCIDGKQIKDCNVIELPR